MMTAEEAFEKDYQEKRAKIEAQKNKNLKETDNVNHYAVKHKLGKKKFERATINGKQVKVYKQLLETMENRKVPMLTSIQASQQAYVRPMEVEREFLDAFSVIIESGYYMEQEDFLELLDMLEVSAQPAHVVEKAKVLDFFALASDLLGYDTEKVRQKLTDPWEKSAIEQQIIESKGYIFQKDHPFSSKNDSLDQTAAAIRKIELNQRSGFLEVDDDHSVSGVTYGSIPREPFRDTHYSMAVGGD